eukprot:SAG11_NODE_8874_length_967_cov_6.228111_2_plen_187_part_01
MQGRSLAELSLPELQELSKQHCFAGYSAVEYDVPGYEGQPVCDRLHCIDFQPMPRLRPNQWRVAPLFERGGWVEYGVAKDEHGQAAYVEHWGTLSHSRGGPYLALRRRRLKPATATVAGVAATQQQQQQHRDGVLVVVGDWFGWIVDRPVPLTATPGEAGMPPDRCSTAQLVANEVARATAAAAAAA